MFNNILLKSIQIGEKAFHILCDVATNAQELEKLGLELIKIAQQIQADFEKQQQSSQAEEKKQEEQLKVEDGDKQ